jgi:hypothetical protein
MVLISMKSDTELGIGSPNYLIWVDYLKVGQFFILLAAILECVYVHRKIRGGEVEYALRVDDLARKLIPWVLYPLYVLCVILVGFDLVNAAITAMVVGLFFSLGIGVALIKYDSIRLAAKRAAIVAKINKTDLADESSSQLLEEAFHLFDADKSGAIEKGELHKVLKALFPNMTRNERLQAVHDLGDLAQSDEFVVAIQTFYRERPRQDPQPPTTRINPINTLTELSEGVLAKGMSVLGGGGSTKAAKTSSSSPIQYEPVNETEQQQEREEEVVSEGRPSTPPSPSTSLTSGVPRKAILGEDELPEIVMDFSPPRRRADGSITREMTVMALDDSAKRVTMSEMSRW